VPVSNIVLKTISFHFSVQLGSEILFKLEAGLEYFENKK